jgi:adenine phosphoribosyltransferase
VNLTDHIRTIPDFPKPGILFRDVTTLLLHPKAFAHAVDQLAATPGDFDLVAGIEARGFIFGAAVAKSLGLGFLPLRKPGKLPGETVSQSYQLEYGTDALHISKGLVPEGARVLLIDDLIATGGTAIAAVQLLRRIGAEVSQAAFVVDLPDLGGADRLRALNLDVRSLTAFDGN